MLDGRRKSATSSNLENSGEHKRSTTFGPKFNRFLVALRITPNQVTLGGILLALVCAYFISQGYFWIGIILITVSGLTDFLDGAIARARKMTSIRGKFLDSVSDRVIDSVIFGSLSWYLIAHNRGELALLPLAILAAGFVVSYERAKAESLGLSGKGGLMERAERLIGLGIAISFNGLILMPVLILILVLTVVTIVHRFLNIWGQASVQDNADFIYNEWLAYAKEKKQKRVENRTPHSLERFRLQRLIRSAEERQAKREVRVGLKENLKASQRSKLGGRTARASRPIGGSAAGHPLFRRNSKKS